MRLSLTIIVLTWMTAASAQAYEAPILHCLQVDAADDVTLHWQAPTLGQADFIEYHLWRQEEFFDDDLGTIADINTTSFLDLGASANEKETYFIEAVFDSAGTEIRKTSELLCTINLAADGFNNRAELEWNRPTSTALDSIYTSFIVQLNYTGAWQSIDTLPYTDTSYVYLSQVCPEPPAIDVDIDFRVLLLDEFGCTSVSIIRDDIAPLIDNNPPSPPIIETVTVDTSIQRAVICWFPSPEGDVQGYRIQNTLEEDIALTFDPSVTSATDFLSNIVLNSQGYVVVARDTCGGNETSADDGIPHFTINLDLEFFRCEQSTLVEWNEYENWEGGVESYVIFGGLAGGTLQPIDTVSGLSDSYVHMDVPLDVNYTYMVKALSANGFKPSLSPRTNIFTVYPEVPEFTYLANVNVLGSSVIELKALIDPAALSTRYLFEKLDRFGEEFEALGSIDQSNADPDGFLTYLDTDVRPAERVYKYRVSVIDSCGNIPSISDTCRNIRTRITIDSDRRQNYISWNPYLNWDGAVLSYNIYQVIDGEPGPLLGVVPNNIFYFEDQVDSLQDYLRNANYCYIVEAIEGINSYGLPQSSFSNVICGTQEPIIFIPNAITPNGDGLNDFFAPVGGYFDRENGYSMTIYDRWGQVVYETDDYYRPWKAQDGNGYVQEGVYVYHIKYTTGDGQLFERYGNISVLIAQTE